LRGAVAEPRIRILGTAADGRGRRED